MRILIEVLLIMADNGACVSVIETVKIFLGRDGYWPGWAESALKKSDTGLHHTDIVKE